MNINVTSREALVAAAREIALAESLSKISIRRVASVCGISVGAIYNYFPTKSELMLAVIEDFWRSAFHGVGDDLFKEKNFCLFIKGVYERLYRNVQEVYESWLEEITRLDLGQGGKEQEARYFEHIKKGLLKVLENDTAIRQDIWNDQFTKTALIDFVFDNLLLLMGKREKECGFLTQMLEQVLYCE